MCRERSLSVELSGTVAPNYIMQELIFNKREEI